jgi:hypothetical protein
LEKIAVTLTPVPRRSDVPQFVQRDLVGCFREDTANDKLAFAIPAAKALLIELPLRGMEPDPLPLTIIGDPLPIVPFVLQEFGQVTPEGAVSALGGRVHLRVNVEDDLLIGLFIGNMNRGLGLVHEILAVDVP